MTILKPNLINTLLKIEDGIEKSLMSVRKIDLIESVYRRLGVGKKESGTHGQSMTNWR